MNLLSKSGKKDYFDANFNLINASAYKHVSTAQGGKLLPFVAKNGKMGFLNRRFQVVVSAKYSRIKAFNEGVAWVLE